MIKTNFVKNWQKDIASYINFSKFYICLLQCQLANIVEIKKFGSEFFLTSSKFRVDNSECHVIITATEKRLKIKKISILFKVVT